MPSVVGSKRVGVPLSYIDILQARTIHMENHDHPPVNSSNWDNPDFCPFCGQRLPDGGPGVVDHIEEKETCRQRFEDWRENIADDIEAEWSG
jgi:hypothetical protein